MVTEHQVRERAYFIWELEGRLGGRADAYWLRAEAELRASAPSPATGVVDGDVAVAPRAAKAPKSAAKKIAEAAKSAEPTSVKPKRAPRLRVEQAALH